MVIRLLALLSLVACVLGSTSTAAYACSCAIRTPAQAVEHADAVFTGTVAEGTAIGPRSPDVYTFRVDNVYKGAPTAEFTLATDADTASCGYPFERGGRYLVFAASDESELSEPVPGVSLTSSLCSGNVPIDPGTGPLRPGGKRSTGLENLVGPMDAELIAALGTPAKPSGSPSPVAAYNGTGTDPGAGAGWAPAAGGAAVVVLVLAGTLALLMRRHRLARGDRD
ncbi:hypothetical protein [Nonomuraea basaltis]|uniref:hypothetical protein n=1 Tax=Nonomuraea basaltis TaxID=2495887 RepID=UPI00110C6BE0|nr:hypothetical protein [Nonomuraea basaltis]TMR96577.1 hypothetical protein EJK15_22725 [Nonomuraea basaltis]